MVPTEEAMITRQMLYSGVTVRFPGPATRAIFAIIFSRSLQDLTGHSERLASNFRRTPSGIKPASLLALDGTAKDVPFPKRFMRQLLLFTFVLIFPKLHSPLIPSRGSRSGRASTGRIPAWSKQ